MKTKKAKRRVRVVPKSFALIGVAGVVVVPALAGCSKASSGPYELGVAAQCVPGNCPGDLGVAASCLPGDPNCTPKPVEAGLSDADADAADAPDADGSEGGDDAGDAGTD
ncbi:MAG: hypothetical protein JST00_08925 [Deltaproteobacteria bacterium]|nr:hypothetical protein [Deltaproteobacteria bacterium]